MSEDGLTRITLRIPDRLHARLTESAARTSKSMNAEIIARLEQSFLSSPKPDAALHLRMSLGAHREMAMSTVELMKRSVNRLADLQQKAVEIDPLTEKRGKPEFVAVRLEKAQETLEHFIEQAELTTELLAEIALDEAEGIYMSADQIRYAIMARNIAVDTSSD